MYFALCFKGFVTMLKHMVLNQDMKNNLLPMSFVTMLKHMVLNPQT